MSGFSKDTLINTLRGFKNINELVVGDCVLNEHNEYKPIKDINVQTVFETYKLNGMCFDEMTCHKNQMFLVKEKIFVYDKTTRHSKRAFSEPKWKYAKDIVNGDFMCISINSNASLPEWSGSYYNQYGHNRLIDNLSKLFNKPSFWYMIGRYVGDGWTRNNYRDGNKYRGGIVICCSKKKESDFTSLKQAIEECGFKINLTEERTSYKMSVYSIELFDFIQRYSKGAYCKIIDGETLNLPVELLTSFINGYKDSDGSFTQDKYKLTSISRNLIYGAGQCIAKSFSTHYHVYHAPMPPTHIIEGRVVNQRDQYQLVWDTNKEKQYKAFYEDGHIWFPVNEVIQQTLDSPVTLYKLIVEDDSYNAYSIVTK